jgi:hypothetical protein
MLKNTYQIKCLKALEHTQVLDVPTLTSENMPIVFRVEEVYLPLDSMVPVRDRGVTGDAGALSVGGGGGGGGDVASTPLPCLRERGSPSSSELKSESCWYFSVSGTISNAPHNRLQQIGQDRNTAQLYIHHKALQGRTSYKSKHTFHRLRFIYLYMNT